MQHDILMILLDLDLRSNFEVDFPRLSPASPSVRPLRMWFDACLCLQNHTQMHPSDSFSLDSRDTTLPCGYMPDSMFYPTTIPVGIRFPGMADGTQPAGRARDGNDVI